METVVIALEELAHYAESTARTMPVTGVVPRAVAEDQIRHALRALREKTPAAGCVRTGRRRAVAARQSLAVRAGGSLPRSPRSMPPDGFAPHARGRSSPRSAGCCSPPAAGAWTRKGSPYFWKAFSGKHRSPGASWLFSARALRAAVLVRLAQLYWGETPSGAAAAVYFTALRHIASLDLDAVLEEADAVEHILRRDPAGVYQRMDERSRRDYRARVETLSRRKNKSEARVAEEALRLAERADGVRRRHIGYWLYENPSARACRGEAARRTFSQTSFSRLRSPRRARCGQKASSRECWRCCRSRKS